jgi:hypothetical protein
LHRGFNYQSNFNRQEENKEGGIIWKTLGYLVSIPKAVFNGLVWFKDIFFGPQDVTSQLNGMQLASAFKL